MTCKRVCLIGAGPSSMSFLGQWKRMESESGCQKLEVVCFEKQATWGGLWNYTWRTGIDDYGEPVHNSMYTGLWSNGPAEALEFDDYPLEKHFGKQLLSYPPRALLFDYLQGYWRSRSLEKCDIRFRQVVRRVEYNDEGDNFKVTVHDLIAGTDLEPMVFDYVINCSGHFSTPNVPHFEGIDSFPATVTHSHDFRHADQYAGQHILVVGSGYSGDDIALQLIKFGARKVTVSFRNNRMPFKLPKGIQQRPLIERIEGKTVHFIDKTSVQVDSMILATGYRHHYPYMQDSLRLTGPNVYFNEGLYNDTVWTRAGNYKLLYMGAMDQYYTFSMFNAQARWCVKYLWGDINLPSLEEMESDMKVYQHRQQAGEDGLKLQAEWVDRLVEEAEYGADLNVTHLFEEWRGFRLESLATYRDQAHTSKFTGHTAPTPKVPFMNNFEMSLEGFLNL